MEIRPVNKSFYILPLFKVIKVKNTLTKEARILFNYDWDDYYQIKIGWFNWSKTF